jgi:hypothetical protein
MNTALASWAQPPTRLNHLEEKSMNRPFGMEFLEEMKPVELNDVNGSEVPTSVCTSYTTSPEGGGSTSDGCDKD